MFSNFIFMFLYIGGCNAGVVPINFRMDGSEHVESSNLKNELTDKFSADEVEILGHSLPDIEKGNSLHLLNSEDKNATVLEISNTNSSNASMDFVPKETLKELNLASGESLAISDVIDEVKSITEFISKNNSDPKESFEKLQVNETLNDEAAESIKLEDELTIANSSSQDLEREIVSELIEIAETILNNTFDQNDTFAIFDDINGTISNNFTQSQTLSNDTLISEVVQTNTGNKTEEFEPNRLNSENLETKPLSNDTNIDVTFLSDAENKTKELKLNNMMPENLEITNDPSKATEGIFSGFEFLIKSEIARNAAKAMEVFNFSDPLTDHIMEENEFHSFLPAFNAGENFNSPSKTDLKTETFIVSSIGELNESKTDLNTPFLSSEETQTLPNSKPLETKAFSTPLNLNNSINGINETDSSNLAENFNGNETSEILSPPEDSEEKIQVAPETTMSEHGVNGSLSSSSTVAVPECPPPGFCFFWFFSQDTCAINEHCLGSRICCRIRCSKTCIEVES